MEDTNMFRQKLIPVWVGILVLSGMFFMGQQTWDPQPRQCEDSAFPTCDGDCDPGLVCTDDPALDKCVCVEEEQCEETYPTCGGTCPEPQVCVDTGQDACACRLECEDSQSPACGGWCPDPQGCSEDPTGAGCVCEDPQPLPCHASAPTCNGECPPGEDCVGVAGGGCVCEDPQPPPHCEDQSTYPTCNGPCPSPLICANLGGECMCVPEDHPCELSPYPACGGWCPPGWDCVDPGQGPCICVEEEPDPCELSPYPACGGSCPPGQECLTDPPGGPQGCVCWPPL
jgi:hypothetical protein